MRRAPMFVRGWLLRFSIFEFQGYVYFSKKTGIRENNVKKEEEASKLMRNYDFEIIWSIYTIWLKSKSMAEQKCSETRMLNG